jgi:hypothetical protein
MHLKFLSIFFVVSGCFSSVNKPMDSAIEKEISDSDNENISDTGSTSATDCHLSTGAGTEGSDRWVDGEERATVVIDDETNCTRTYELSTTQFRVDDLPNNPRVFSETSTQPVVRSGHAMFDALYAMALEEIRENSVDSISDGSFNGGHSVECPAGGCFETGRKWTYVWTRDTAYAVFLSLGLIDPLRAKNSLEFKLSARRDGTDLQIVQDTGTGGSYPISSDRVVWAMGAFEVLKYLEGTERRNFRDSTYEALSNTAEHDRVVVWDISDGLYTGEQSFLDWREQSYPDFTANDPVQIGMSKSLSTNVGHLRLLEITALLAEEKGLESEVERYQNWADSLKEAIALRFWLEEEGGFSTLIPSILDLAPVGRFDLLASSLAVIARVGSEAQRRLTIETYPHFPKGPPVIWPQQQFTPIYHNRGIWPFVTAFGLKAAKQVGNAAVVSAGVQSLMRGAALNLSNMENFEVVTGLPYKDDEGEYSGPVVNSQRQLWSVAGYASMVQDIIFGLETSQSGIQFEPFIPLELRNTLFSGADTIALSRIPYKGKQISVVLNLGEGSEVFTGVLVAQTVLLNGVDVGLDIIDSDVLAEDSVFEIFLGPANDTSDDKTELSNSDTENFQNIFGPRTPSIDEIVLDNNHLGISFDIAGELPSDVTIDVYRDELKVASDLSGTTSYWVDSSSTPSTHSHCYTIETRFASGTRSQHAKPVCWWGINYERIDTIGAQSFNADGGVFVFNHNEWHYENWGDSTDRLTVSNYTAQYTGLHLIQLRAGNGSGPVNTGITCAIKKIEVYEGAALIDSGFLIMPHLGSWNSWQDSSFVRVDLNAGTNYNIVILEDEYSINMSEREHFVLYDQTGGSNGRSNFVNIAQIKILALEVNE